MSKRPSLAETMRQATSAPDATLAPAMPEMRQARPMRVADRAPGFYAATRAGKKKVTATLDPPDHKRLRQLALDRDVTTEALLGEAISDLFQKYGRER